MADPIVPHDRSRRGSVARATLLALVAAAVGYGCFVGACGKPAAPPATPAQPTTSRPLAFAPGETLTYTVEGEATLGGDQDSRAYMPRPGELRITGAAGGTGDLTCTFVPLPVGSKPPMRIPDPFHASVDALGLVRVTGLPDHGHTHDAADPAMGPRYYELIYSLLLQRPAEAAAGKETWVDVALFPKGETGYVGTMLCKRLPPATLGGRVCEAIRWDVEVGIPHFHVGDAMELVASGLTFYDAAAKRVLAAEVEFRVASALPSWGTAGYDWLRISTPEAAYTGEALRQPWIDRCFTVKTEEMGRETQTYIIEDGMVKSLFGIHAGVLRFLEDAKIDVDRDGKGEWPFLCEQAGFSNLRTPGGVLGPKIPVDQVRGRYGCHPEYGVTDANGVATAGTTCRQSFLASADGPIRSGVKPPDGDARHADAQEALGGWCCFSWPADAPGLVLFVGTDGEIHGTRDLPWVGPAGGPQAPTLTRPEGPGIRWEVRTIKGDPPKVRMTVVILDPKLTAPAESYTALARHWSNMIRLRQPDMATLLAPGAMRRLRELERRWREAFRDRQISGAELGPIVDEVDRILTGRTDSGG